MRLIDADLLMDDINHSLNEMTKIGIAVDGDWLWAKLNDALEKTPTVEPERKKGEWIPISERLPEEKGSYLVTDDAGGVKTVQDDEFLRYEDGTPLWLYSQSVTAWMPLPEPWEGEQE